MSAGLARWAVGALIDDLGLRGLGSGSLARVATAPHDWTHLLLWVLDEAGEQPLIRAACKAMQRGDADGACDAMAAARGMGREQWEQWARDEMSRAAGGVA